SFGRWHRPCDIVSLTTPSTNDNADDDDDNNDAHLNHQTNNKLCLFAWSKPMYARLIHEFNYQQWNNKNNNNNHDDDDFTFSPMYHVMAYSLTYLNARYSSGATNHRISSYSTMPSFLLDDPFTTTCSSSSSSSLSSVVHYHCHEGTAHGLLLDLFNIPVIDHVSELFIKHHQHQLHPHPHDTNSFMIPCRALDVFFKSFIRLIHLWLCCSTNQSTLSKSVHSAENSIDDHLINQILASKEVDAFLVDHLKLSLSFNKNSIFNAKISSTTANYSIGGTNDLSKHLIGCLMHGKLYLDSTLGVTVFANLSQIASNQNAATPLHHLLMGCINDPLLRLTSSPYSDALQYSMEKSLLAQIIDFICPYGQQPIKVNLM
ncbi:unnamed protein product, partial [Schistosoma turkestanicum]